VRSWEASNTNCIVFGLTQPRLESTIHCIRGETEHLFYILTYGSPTEEAEDKDKIR